MIAYDNSNNAVLSSTKTRSICAHCLEILDTFQCKKTLFDK